MDSRQATAQQRAHAQLAIGHLKAVTEFFGTDDTTQNGVDASRHKCGIWIDKIKEFEDWLWDESPIA